ncbi:double-strand break repair helicase AddA [Defluviimonas sp. WL0075]|uniref:DNA 3'-5' helicase n=2 Tax=Albidovulum sediminicola TaxID=2984331 RepID=A0ABT2YWL1_9RHOB|nr:double-strand break repair helicase AddA [Defluviimonas sp. WL0075]MCV2863252.1 double-strand break repair helicase AddA [Defluviimonas sp. WL0075]
MDDATRAQVRAADPAASTWLSANAGSGKTRVLIDRVARLLLGGTEPQRILCLTYTKAAASEMQNRLFNRLGEWAMLPEPLLRGALADLGVPGPIDVDALARARRLFARAIETPGGLKIQTIHSFCAALLRRFPVEAGASPDFTELDDRTAALLRAEIVEELAAGADIGAVDALAAFVSGEDLDALLADLSRNGELFASPLTRDEAFALFGLPAGFDAETAYHDTFDGSERALFAEAVPVLERQSPTMVALAGRLRLLNPEQNSELAFKALREEFLYRKESHFRAEAKFATVPTKKAQGALGDLLADFQALMDRVAQTQGRLFALAAAEKTLALHRFAGAFLPRYAARKAGQGWLDFDDLIRRAAALLGDRAVAAWVLFRLDGGIDHVLVDEAQDTSPAQWKVIERLTEEFTAGEGARGTERTIFVVGDKKQSIYSFQGADLNEFDSMQGHFTAKFAAVGRAMQGLELLHSFRSADAILRVVDLTFDERVNRGLGGTPKHRAFHIDKPGRVDLWAPIPKPDKVEPNEWYAPIDILPDAHENVVLARKIAAEIRRMIDTGVTIADRGGARRVHEGDFLILVQRRGPLFSEIIRACKAERLEIAGADRLKLGGELAVKDLAALLSFLALQEDDLSLAAALRSPLFGWSEGQLYDLAQGRADKTYLWQALRDRADDFPQTLAMLHDLRRWADFLRPYELLERILTRHGGRRNLLARLGPEAEDGIDALLAQALAYERTEVPSLTGFLVWMQTDEVEVKRRLDSATRAIRVMTVHGAKGLEAPIVILPDTAKRPDTVRDEIYVTEEGVALWQVPAAESPGLVADLRDGLKDRQRQERMRLLYVAMTRAESWLIVCAAGDTGTGEESWHALIDAAMDKAGAESSPLMGEAWDFGPGKRFALGHWPAPAPGDADGADQAAPTPPALAPWITAPAPPPPDLPATLSPSALGGAKALPGEAGLDEEAAKRRGTMIHLALEHLPLWPRADWPEIAATLLSAEMDADPAETAAVLAEAARVLDNPALAPILTRALREVELTAAPPELGGRRLHGTIDLLLVEADRVLAIDYKSNAIIPEGVGVVPDGILRQMGAYAAMLGCIYPDRRIETAILWTASGEIMPLPGDIVRAALQTTTTP